MGTSKGRALAWKEANPILADAEANSVPVIARYTPAMPPTLNFGFSR
jgi:hypothetical protein